MGTEAEAIQSSPRFFLVSHNAPAMLVAVAIVSVACRVEALTVSCCFFSGCAIFVS
jgi:hypothetical protein